MAILEQRKKQVYTKGKSLFEMECSKPSLAGSVSQRACVFCGSRVVLYPIADAVHLVHGPIGCAAYTWDIRGALSSGPELHRMSFSTDLREIDVINGGERKLYRALLEVIERYHPKAAFVYSTCIIGIIGDDVGAVCKKVSLEKGIPVLAVDSEGFKGTKKDGYRAACGAIFKLTGQAPIDNFSKYSINIMGEFNIAGETWLIRSYYEKMGIQVVACLTGDARIDDIRRSHGAALNVVQCSGSMVHLAKMFKEHYGTPYLRVSYFGIEDMSEALYSVARFFKDQDILRRAQKLVREEVEAIYPKLLEYKRKLTGKRAAVYVGGAFKAFALVRTLRLLGMKVVMVGSQTGNKDDYQQLRNLCDEGTIIVDDSNPMELSSFLRDQGVDLFIGGVKERPLAYKLGIGFCDHNHERKKPLAGFAGMLNFTEEIYASVQSPVWNLVPRRQTSQPDLGDKKK